MRLAIAAPANTLLKQEGLKLRKTIVFVKKLVDSLVSTFEYRNLPVLHWEIFHIVFFAHGLCHCYDWNWRSSA
jgi:hypothetical protein